MLDSLEATQKGRGGITGFNSSWGVRWAERKHPVIIWHFIYTNTSVLLCCNAFLPIILKYNLESMQNRLNQRKWDWIIVQIPCWIRTLCLWLEEEVCESWSRSISWCPSMQKHAGSHHRGPATLSHIELQLLESCHCTSQFPSEEATLLIPWGEMRDCIVCKCSGILVEIP